MSIPSEPTAPVPPSAPSTPPATPYSSAPPLSPTTEAALTTSPPPALPASTKDDAWGLPGRPLRAHAAHASSSTAPATSAWQRFYKIAALAGFLGWTGFIAYQMLDNLLRGWGGPNWLAFFVLMASMLAITVAAFLPSQTGRILSINTAALVSILGTLLGLIITIETLRWRSPLREVLPWIAATAPTPLAVFAAIAWTRLEVRRVWSAAIADLQPRAASWDDEALRQEQKRVPHISPGQAGWRILAILPLLVVGIFALIVLSLSLFQFRRIGTEEMVAIVGCFTVIFFYFYGLYAPHWVTRFLSVGGSAGVAWGSALTLISLSWEIAENGRGEERALILLTLGLTLLCAFCLWGAYRYTTAELVRLAAKAREAALPKDDDSLDATRWDEGDRPKP